MQSVLTFIKTQTDSLDRDIPLLVWIYFTLDLQIGSQYSCWVESTSTNGNYKIRSEFFLDLLCRLCDLDAVELRLQKRGLRMINVEFFLALFVVSQRTILVNTYWISS